MAFNIPGTDTIFRTSDAITSIINLGSTFANFMNPFQSLSGIFGGGRTIGDDEGFRQSIRDSVDGMREGLDSLESAASQSNEGLSFLGQSSGLINNFFDSESGRTFTLRQILDGSAAGIINDIPGVSNDVAFEWWSRKLNDASGRLVTLSNNFDEFSYNVAKNDFNEAFPNVTTSFEDFSRIVEGGIDDAGGQELINGGFSGNQVADVNGGAITIGGDVFQTTEQQQLDNTESIEQLQTDLATAQNELQSLQDEFDALTASGELTDEKLEQLQTDFDAKSQELEVLQQQEADRQAQIEADALQEQENQQFIADNNLSPDHFSLTPEEQERDLFISQSQQFLDLEGAKADLLTQKQLFDALESDTNATQEDKDAAMGNLNTSLATLIQAGLAIGVPIGQILSSDDVTGAVENQPEDVGLQFRQQTPDLEISPTLGPDLGNVAGLLGGGGFTTRPSTISRFQAAPIAQVEDATFNQFEDTFNPTVTASGFPKPKSLLNTGNSTGLLGRT